MHSALYGGEGLLLEFRFPARGFLRRMFSLHGLRWLVLLFGLLTARLARPQTSDLFLALLMQALIRKYAPAVIIIAVVLLLLYLRSFFYR